MQLQIALQKQQLPVQSMEMARLHVLMINVLVSDFDHVHIKGLQ